MDTRIFDFGMNVEDKAEAQREPENVGAGRGTVYQICKSISHYIAIATNPLPSKQCPLMYVFDFAKQSKEPKKFRLNQLFAVIRFVTLLFAQYNKCMFTINLLAIRGQTTVEATLNAIPDGLGWGCLLCLYLYTPILNYNRSSAERFRLFRLEKSLKSYSNDVGAECTSRRLEVEIWCKECGMRGISEEIEVVWDCFSQKYRDIGTSGEHNKFGK